jgi:putative endonuclease
MVQRLMRRRDVGRQGEALAAQFLSDQGWVVTATNWRCAAGELDIVARDGATLVVVEVRTRRAPRLGRPEESLGYAKRTRLFAVTQALLRELGWRGAWRIDVIAIELAGAGRPQRLTHYPNAFSAIG